MLVVAVVTLAADVLVAGLVTLWVPVDAGVCAAGAISSLVTVTVVAEAPHAASMLAHAKAHASAGAIRARDAQRGVRMNEG
ncbi:MAG: hypothetical protein ACLP01_05560 [Solirubrobacteraceae bacterium]